MKFPPAVTAMMSNARFLGCEAIYRYISSEIDRVHLIGSVVLLLLYTG